MGKCLVAGGILVFCTLLTAKAQAVEIATVPPGVEYDYRITFAGDLDNGFGGLPPTHVSGWLGFRDLPPTYTRDDWLAQYPVDCGEVTLTRSAATLFTSNEGKISIQDNATIGSSPGSSLRDEYTAMVYLDDVWDDSFGLIASGVQANTYAYPPDGPSVFETTDLPTSMDALSGFTNMSVFLSFENLSTGRLYSASAPIQEFSLMLVPEPSTWLLLCGGVAGLLVRARRRRRQLGSTSRCSAGAGGLMMCGSRRERER